MRKFTAKDFERLRWRTGAMLGITMTDRCPVGCAHCSVAAEIGDRGPSANPLFLEQCEELLSAPEVEVVIVTGGEPFGHPGELARLCERAVEHGKRVVVHTSAYWGGRQRQSHGGVSRTLELVDALVVGVDRYHEERLSADALVAAFRATHSAGAWLVVQTIDGDPNADHVAYANELLRSAFGSGWSDAAELVVQPLLAVGRGKELSPSSHDPEGAARLCDLVHRPMLRFDGEVVACCNEAVIRGAGPAALRRPIEGGGARDALSALRADPLVDLLRRLPSGTVMAVARQVAGEPSANGGTSKCDACWRAGEILERLDACQLERVQALCRIITSEGGTQ